MDRLPFSPHRQRRFLTPRFLPPAIHQVKIIGLFHVVSHREIFPIWILRLLAWPPMDPFNSARRELLRFGGIGLAATAVPAAYAAAQRSPNPATAQGIFDIRTYGAVGDGKAVDSPAIHKAIEAPAAAARGTVLFPARTWL